MTQKQLDKQPGVQRCSWCGTDELYQAYHDQEWGVAEQDPQALFERLVLEGMQAGLSWLTVLRKRAHMREVFFNFDMQRLADAGEADVEAWLVDPGVIRHRGKIAAMISNAQLSVAHNDLAAWLWSFAPKPGTRAYADHQQVPAQTQQSVAMSKALKAAGYKFVGPTICYAFMQSVGMVNDHVEGCWRYTPCQQLLLKAGLL